MTRLYFLLFIIRRLTYGTLNMDFEWKKGPFLFRRWQCSMFRKSLCFAYERHKLLWLHTLFISTNRTLPFSSLPFTCDPLPRPLMFPSHMMFSLVNLNINLSSDKIIHSFLETKTIGIQLKFTHTHSLTHTICGSSSNL